MELLQKNEFSLFLKDNINEELNSKHKITDLLPLYEQTLDDKNITLDTFINCINFFTGCKTIEFFSKNQKKVKIKKQNEFKNLIHYFQDTKYKTLSSKITRNYAAAFNQADILLKVDEISKQNNIPSFLRQHFSTQIESVIAHLLVITPRKETEKLKYSDSFYETDFNHNRHRLYYSKLDIETQIQLIEKNDSNIKYIKNINPKVLDYFAKTKAHLIWAISENAVSLKWEHIFAALSSGQSPERNTRKIIYKKIKEEIPSSMVGNLLIKDFMIINYIKNQLIKLSFIETFLKKDHSLFREIESPSVSTCILALELEEIYYKKVNLSLTNLEPNNAECNLYRFIKIVPNSNHDETLMNLKEKKQVCDLIAGR